jgi:hypothetical protein
LTRLYDREALFEIGQIKYHLTWLLSRVLKILKGYSSLSSSRSTLYAPPSTIMSNSAPLCLFIWQEELPVMKELYRNQC